MMDLLTANDRPGHYPESYYASVNAPLPPFAPLAGEVRADVCVIGGGFTGLSAALHLARAGYDVRLLEASRVGFGASGRNGGQVGTGQRVEQDALETMVGQDTARALWQVGLDAVDLVRDLAAQGNVPVSDGIIHADHRAGDVAETHAYVDHLQRVYGYDRIAKLDAQALRERVGSPAYHGGAINHGGCHLDPLRYVLALARQAAAAGVTIHETSRVEQIDRGASVRVRTASGRVSASHVVLACNGYLGGLEPEVGRKVMPINNFIAVTEPLEKSMRDSLITGGHAVADGKFVVNYFRLQDDRMVFGGSESYGYRFPADIAAKVRKPMLEIFPQLSEAKITHAWGGTLGITMNRMPHVTRIAGNILSASGFSGHGVAMGTMAGRIMAEAIGGQAERFDLMARVPTRGFPGGTRLRSPLLVLAMLWYSFRDRL